MEERRGEGSDQAVSTSKKDSERQPLHGTGQKTTRTRAKSMTEARECSEDINRANGIVDIKHFDEKNNQRSSLSIWKQKGLRDCVKAAQACDKRGEGLLGIEELQKMAKMIGASRKSAQALLDSCQSVELPQTGQKVITYQSLFRYLWPNSTRVGIEDARVARREPKYLFNPHLKSGILNDVRETMLEDIGEKSPFTRVNRNYHSTSDNPIVWKEESDVRHGPWVGDRPLLPMDRVLKNRPSAQGFERSVSMLIDTWPPHTGLKLNPFQSFIANPRHYDILLGQTPPRTPSWGVLKPPEAFRPFRSNAFLSFSPTMSTYHVDSKSDPDPSLQHRASSSLELSARTDRHSVSAPDDFATSKLMPSIGALKLFHRHKSYNTNKLDVSDISGNLSSSRLSMSTLGHERTVSSSCPKDWRRLLPMRNVAFSRMQGELTHSNSLLPGKHVL